MSLALTHIGEALVARLLTRIAQDGGLDQLRCRQDKHIRLIDDIGIGSSAGVVFKHEEARLRLVTQHGSYNGDGAQRIDVLCVGPSKPVAMELKLGDTRLSRKAFCDRFLKACELSAHATPCLSGAMPAVMERHFPEGVSGALTVLLDDNPRELAEHWWLVLRRQVWESWKCSPTNPPPTKMARILLIEDIVALHGSSEDFDCAVREVIGGGFAARWDLQRHLKTGT